MRRGLGDTDLSALGDALARNALNPSYTCGLSYQPVASMNRETFACSPDGYFLDDTTAQQIASLLGGSVFKGQPENLFGADIPLANWIKLPDGNVFLAAKAAWLQRQAMYTQPPQCGFQDQLAGLIPGGKISSDCLTALKASGTNILDTVSQNQPEYVPPQSPVGTIISGNWSPGDVYAPNAVNVLTTTPPASSTTNIPVGQPGGPEGPPAAAALFPGLIPASPTPNATPATVNGSTLASPSPPLPGGAIAPVAGTDWASMLTAASIAGVPNWAWLVGGAALLLFLGGRK